VCRDNAVGIATSHRLDGQGIEFQWRRDFPHRSIRALQTTQPPTQWVHSLPVSREGGAGVDHLPLSSADVKKRVELYITFPLGLHGLLSGELYCFYLLWISMFI
jgi:hypothetical protein